MNFQPTGLGGCAVSWQGVNDFSAHPASTGRQHKRTPPTGSALAAQTIVLNTLGSLTNRENRFASPRFADDFFNVVNGHPRPDGYSDDLPPSSTYSSGDKVNDFYPSLYPGLFTGSTSQLVWKPGYPNVPRPAGSFVTMAFPYIYPGAYTYPQVVSADQYGWIHSPTPVIYDQAGNTYMFENDTMPSANVPNQPIYPEAIDARSTSPGQ